MRIKRLAQGRYCRAGVRTGTSGMEVRGLNKTARPRQPWLQKTCLLSCVHCIFQISQLQIELHCNFKSALVWKQSRYLKNLGNAKKVFAFMGSKVARREKYNRRICLEEVTTLTSSEFEEINKKMKLPPKTVCAGMWNMDTKNLLKRLKTHCSYCRSPKDRSFINL